RHLELRLVRDVGASGDRIPLGRPDRASRARPRPRPRSPHFGAVPGLRRHTRPPVRPGPPGRARLSPDRRIPPAPGEVALRMIESLAVRLAISPAIGLLVR